MKLCLKYSRLFFPNTLYIGALTVKVLADNAGTRMINERYTERTIGASRNRYHGTLDSVEKVKKCKYIIHFNKNNHA